MTLTKEISPALILIDIQKGFEDEAYWGGQRNNPDAETNAATLLKHWRAHHLPIFHIQHLSSNPESKLSVNNPGHHFQDIVAPSAGETVIQKSVNSAFIGTNLKELLDKHGITTVVIAGLTTDHCVSTTTRMAGNYGYNTFIVADATATFGKKGIDGQHYDGETMHQTALAQLNEEFATVISMHDALSIS
jgi:nicotinamidase-related amidase